MAKFYSLALVSLLLLALGSCQSLEQISIDYMQPEAADPRCSHDRAPEAAALSGYRE